MKMNIGIMITACLILFATSNVFAADGTTTTAGQEVVIAGDANKGGNLTFTPSPTTVMGWRTTLSAFTLVTLSKNNEGNENGFAYCMSSEDSNVFKMVLTEYGTIKPPAAAGTTVTGFE